MKRSTVNDITSYHATPTLQLFESTLKGTHSSVAGYAPCVIYRKAASACTKQAVYFTEI